MDAPSSTAVYIRVSTVGQNAASQKLEIQKYLDGHGITDATVYLDKATGTNLDRPAFQELEAAIFNGQIKTVIVYKLDRLSRSLKDGINTICEWADKGVRIIAVTQQIDISGTVGKMICSILLGVAEMEQETRRERQAAGIAAAKERGVYEGGHNRGHRKAKPARAKELLVNGLTHNEIATALGVSRRSVIRYLQQTAS